MSKKSSNNVNVSNVHTGQDWEELCKRQVCYRRGFEGVFMDGCSSVDVTQSEGDLPDFNQSEY